VSGVLSMSEAKRLLVKLSALRLQGRRVQDLKQGRKILQKLEDLDESIAIVARELARQIKGKKGRDSRPNASAPDKCVKP